MLEEKNDQVYCPNSEGYLRSKNCISMRTPRCLRMKCPQIYRNEFGEAKENALIYCIKMSRVIEAPECLNRRSVSCYVCKFKEYETTPEQPGVSAEILEMLEKDSGYAYESMEDDSEDLSYE